MPIDSAANQRSSDPAGKPLAPWWVHTGFVTFLFVQNLPSGPSASIFNWKRSGFTAFRLTFSPRKRGEKRQTRSDFSHVFGLLNDLFHWLSR
ncbi:MAG: hypothetical protein R3C56_28405 [Pirellulaceae bacterium]